MTYVADNNRYERIPYRRSGKSGLVLPAISLGLWQNFGHVDLRSNYEQILYRAFDLGITHFDLANNYGPPPGSAESNFGDILQKGFGRYRDEMIISTKAGFTMWDGPYGDWGSKKYLVASLNQSLKRMQLDYVDIFYHHRPDPLTPLEETMGALDLIVRQGKALYAGISNYPPELAEKAFKILRELGTPCVIHQPKYSMFERTPEKGLLDVLEDHQVGCIAFSPLAQGMLTDKYLQGIPAESRASRNPSLKPEQLTPARLAAISRLNEMAQQRGQKLAEMAVAWLLRDDRVTSVLIGASKVAHVEDAYNALSNLSFTKAELKEIDSILDGAE
ncbi:MAG: L-glyceraldehyde 3-phosphate reductase [Bacteroidota bacterium]|jgi:L-glyceraldehyde 3-phosphate reductase